MTVALIALIAVLAGALAVLAGRNRGTARQGPSRQAGEAPGRILFPFVASALSRRALDAALRLANAEDAVLVPVFLARVPLHLPLDSPLPRQSELAIALQEAIEQRAASFGVAVDARIERGRTNRHALRRTIAQERFDRIVIAAAARGAHGFGPDDVAWLLENAEGEIIVLRPGKDDRLNGKPRPSPRRQRRRPTGRRRDGDRVADRRIGGPASARRSPATH